ncbi:MAG TPA: cell division protein FtsL [Fibrobacteraceae bacterium]|nr:cell division protein FtsL [Fibrobacteraceae bacterium]
MRTAVGIGWLGMGFVVIALLSGILSVPVWKQNRYAALMRTQTELQKERLALESEIRKLDMENRRLSSLSRIEPIAKSMGMGFFAVPLKVMEIPR